MPDKPLPDDIYARIFTLLVFTFPLASKPEQAEAKETLHATLLADEPRRLPGALEAYICAFMRNARGKIIPLHKNRPTMLARDLKREVELWLDAQLMQGAQQQIRRRAA